MHKEELAAYDDVMAGRQGSTPVHGSAASTAPSPTSTAFSGEPRNGHQRNDVTRPAIPARRPAPGGGDASWERSGRSRSTGAHWSSGPLPTASRPMPGGREGPTSAPWPRSDWRAPHSSGPTPSRSGSHVHGGWGDDNSETDDNLSWGRSSVESTPNYPPRDSRHRGDHRAWRGFGREDVEGRRGPAPSRAWERGTHEPASYGGADGFDANNMHRSWGGLQDGPPSESEGRCVTFRYKTFA